MCALFREITIVSLVFGVSLGILPRANAARTAAEKIESCQGLVLPKKDKLIGGVQPKIISLNTGKVRKVEWGPYIVRTSMRRTPVPFLDVRVRSIEGDKFSEIYLHGQSWSRLYVLGIQSLTMVLNETNGKYEPGSLGENITLDSFDEEDVSAGDIFQFGEVIVEATFPRIPCKKTNACLENNKIMRALVKGGRTGVYFRVLKPGKIYPDSKVTRLKRAEIQIKIIDLFKLVGHSNLRDPKVPMEKWFELAEKNGAIPPEWIGNLQTEYQLHNDGRLPGQEEELDE